MNPTDYDKLENMPTSLFTEITDNPDDTETMLRNVTDHTRAGETHTVPGQDPGFNYNGNGQTSEGPQQLTAGSLVPASLAVDLVDMVLPVLIVLLMDKAFNKKVHKSYFQATAEEKEVITPVLQNYLDSIKVKIDDPFNALIIVLVAVYGTKIIEVSTGNRDKPDMSNVTRATSSPKKRNKTANYNAYQRNYQKEYRMKKKRDQERGLA